MTKICRQTSDSWKLLHLLIRSIPSINAAQILSERKFITILRETLEEAQEQTTKSSVESKTVREPASEDDSISYSSRPSKKRKRSGEVVSSATQKPDSLLGLLEAVSATLICISDSIKIASDTIGLVQGTVFSAEYMKMVLTATAEESAKILGSWLFLTQKIIPQIAGISSAARTLWISPFIQIWQFHIAGTEDLIRFSLFCTQPLLSILRAVSEHGENPSNWQLELDQLVARNIVIPAKISKADDPESDLLNTLTRVSVIQDSANASLLFDVAIRSLQPSPSYRRRPQDNASLQTVFTTLKDAMPPQRAKENRTAIQKMLQSAIDCNVTLELPLMRSVTSEYALTEEMTDWALLSTIIGLDANTFLISNEHKDLLKEVLTRITAAAFEPVWPELYDRVVQDVTIPLMKEFAKARDLSTFIRHWHAQLMEFERLRKEDRSHHLPVFCAWEDSTLQAALSKLLEPSLTVQQITQLLDWLSLEIRASPDAVCVILEAIAGSITREDVTDAIGLRLYHIMFDVKYSTMLDRRYRWRSWGMLSRMLSWIQADELDGISRLWLEKESPFDTLDAKGGVSEILNIAAEDQVGLETFEIFKFACAAWSNAKDGSEMKIFATKLMLRFLQGLANDFKAFSQDLKSDKELGKEHCSSVLNTLQRGTGWMLWAFIKCIFVEYPTVLQ